MMTTTDARPAHVALSTAKLLLAIAFLALGAVFYVFAEPWITLQLRFLGV